MSGEMVKYHNDLNGITFRAWTAEELNFFFVVISRLRERGTNLITMTQDEIEPLLAKSYSASPSKTKTVLKNAADKIARLIYRESFEKSDGSSRYAAMTLFQTFIIDWNKYGKYYVEVKVSDNFEYILNHLQARFTVFELEEYVSLKSKYSKELYRHLKQWRTVGRKSYTVDELKSLLAVPDGYTTKEINRYVIGKAKEELSQVFEDFKITSHRSGRFIDRYDFTWKPEITGEWVPGQPHMTPKQRIQNGRKIREQIKLLDEHDQESQRPADQELQRPADPETLRQLNEMLADPPSHKADSKPDNDLADWKNQDDLGWLPY